MSMYDPVIIEQTCSFCLEFLPCAPVGYISSHGYAFSCKKCSKKHLPLEIMELVGWRKVRGFTGGIPDELFKNLEVK